MSNRLEAVKDAVAYLAAKGHKRIVLIQGRRASRSAGAAKPSDLGGAAVLLASDAARYVHGHVLAVEGGWLAR